MELLRPEYDMNAMGQRMRFYREQRGITVEAVREYMQFSSVQSVYKWESGKCFPSADNLMALAELYQVNPVELMPKREVFQWRILVERIGQKIKMDYLVSV